MFLSWGHALSDLARITGSAKEYAAAVEKYCRAAEIDPTDTAAHHSLYYTLLSLADMSQGSQRKKHSSEQAQSVSSRAPTQAAAANEEDDCSVKRRSARAAQTLLDLLQSRFTTGAHKNGPARRQVQRFTICYAARLDFAAGFGSGFAAFLAFSFAANSCLTLRATASVSTP